MLVLCAKIPLTCFSCTNISFFIDIGNQSRRKSSLVNILIVIEMGLQSIRVDTEILNTEYVDFYQDGIEKRSMDDLVCKFGIMLVEFGEYPVDELSHISHSTSLVYLETALKDTWNSEPDQIAFRNPQLLYKLSRRA